MTVNLTSSLDASVIRTLTDQSTSLSAVLNNQPVAPVTDPSAALAKVDPASVVETSAVLQNDSTSLRVDSLSVAYIGSKVDALSNGAIEVSGILNKLQSLATRAESSGLSAGQRIQVDGEFQALRLRINLAPPYQPPGSEFTAGSLLGSLGASAADKTATAKNSVVGGFTDTNLLGPASATNLLTPASAQQAVATVAAAQQNIADQQATLSSLQQTVSFAVASNDSALQNQDAARSTLTEADLVDQSAAVSIQANLQADVANAKAAQVSKLPTNILQLLAV